MRTDVRKVYVLDGGTMTVEASSMVPGTGFGQPLVIAVRYFLLETARGYVLVDTGNAPMAINDPVGAWGPELAAAVNARMDPEHHPYEQLRLVGLGANDISMVIYTHLHHDHCGGARLFPDATHVVQRSEHRWAFSLDPFAAFPYNPPDYRHESLQWLLAEGDWCIRPGIHLVTTPGHSPGHQSIVLWDTPDCGTVILAGDAIYCRENVQRDVPPGINTDLAAASASMHRLTALAQATDATMLVSHEADFYDLLPHAPEPLARLSPDVRRYYDEGVRHLYRDALDPGHAG